ncbi:exo-1,3-beta-D-glucanase [Leptodontidium sp. MPI-SDFR-AT-0119]|nr:exo-1,3-beta-D-glucanase [Leptodontidium sp. MPI-SDFR-AT-0119]
MAIRATLQPRSNRGPVLQSNLDIVSIIDGLVLNYTLYDPKFNSSGNALTTLLESAENLKRALSPSIAAKVPAQKRADNATAPIRPPVTPSALEKARAIVQAALEEAGERNARRVKNPRLNHYYTQNDTQAAISARSADNDLFLVNSTVAEAAALVAEADAMYRAGNTTSKRHFHSHSHSHSHRKRASSFWIENISHTGSVPFGADASYPVYRNVKDPLFGAVGDGIHDDTAAINKAIGYGSRCGENCGSSSVKPALVYFPAGTYLVSTSIIAYYNTQLVGNANTPPTILAAPKFIGLGVISSDVYTGGNGGAEEWYINQSNFLRQIRNFVIDVSKAELNDCSGIHWQVAQATSIQDVTFLQSSAAGKSHMGIFAENGSGGFMSDLTFINGALGIRCGNQQFTTRNFKFYGCKTAIDLLWDWGWTWKSLYIENAEIAISMAATYRGGSILVLDSKFVNCLVGIFIASPNGATANEQFSVTLDNLVIQDVTYAVSKNLAQTLLGGSKTISSWTLGKVYDSSNPAGKFQTGVSVANNRPESTMLLGGPNGGYLERSKPQYKEIGSEGFLSAKFLAKGDGVTDDSIGLNLLFLVAITLNRPVFFPMGSYIIKDTLNIPVGSRIVGEVWSQIVAEGAKFADMANPYVAVRVGDQGSSGVMEIQDMMFTAKGATAGVILMEWNVAQSSPGSAAMWDSHFRIGGATGNKLQAADCPKLTGSVKSSCIAGSMMLHMTASSTGYLENVWAWVADHDLDSGPAQTQVDIYVARGILVESTGPTWLYGTSSEHAMLYQYQVSGARNLFMGMIQTESPYFAPAVTAPTPFKSAIGKFPNDPSFSDCPATSPKCSAPWGLRIVDSYNVQILGAGLYNWFYGAYSQACVDTQDCQQKVVSIESSTSIWLYNLYTIGTVEMLNAGTAKVLAKDNTNTNEHPFTSIVTAWLGSSAYDPDDAEDDDEPEDDLPACDESYNSVDGIISNIANIPFHCRDHYLIGAQSNELSTTLSDYQKIINDDYDKKFDIYSRAIKELVPAQLLDYARKHLSASGFFTCQESVWHNCCVCSPYWGCSGGTCEKDCTSGYRWQAMAACPTSVPEPSDQASLNAVAYTCIDRDGFDKDVSERYGISGDWVVFSDHTARIHAGCWQGGPDCAEQHNTIWTGFPSPGTYEVDNPKDIVKPILDGRTTFQSQMANQAYWASHYLNVVDESEIADAAAIPIYLTASAVSSMTDVVETANEITAAERKAFIVNFVSAILMIIPGAGIPIRAGLVPALRRMLTLIGEVGNPALAIYSMVDNPSSAPFEIIGLLLGGSASGSAFKSAASKRKGITNTERNTLPDKVKGGLDRIDTVRNACYRK